MFKYVNSLSGRLYDLKEFYKKKSNVTLVCHALRVPLSISVCLGWSPVPVGCPWLGAQCYSLHFSEGYNEAETMPAAGSWVPIIHRLAERVIYVVNGSLVLVRAPEAEVIYLCTEPSCTQQHSIWPRMRKHPGLPARDLAFLGVLVTFW